MPSSEDMLELMRDIRSRALPEYRVPARAAGEADARALLREKAGSFTPEDFGRFARSAGADQWNARAPSAQRWGPGLAQPQMNNWLARIDDTNRAIGLLWQCTTERTYETYERVRADRAPGGDMLASLVLYLKDPEHFAVKIPSLEHGAVALELLPSRRYFSYQEFNEAIQRWRSEYHIPAVEVDVFLIESDPSRKAHGAASRPPLKAESLQSLLERILADYTHVRETEPFGSNSEMWRIFDQMRNAIVQMDEVSSRGSLSVKPSVGVGNWANVPWVGVLDSRAAQSIRDGIYCVYLFRRDMSGVYLTLNQGVTAPREKLGWPEAKVILRSRAEEVRRFSGNLADAGFHQDDEIDLRSPGLGSDYEASTIAYKLYERGAVPADDELRSDLGLALHAYERFIESTRLQGPEDQVHPAPLPHSTSFDLSEAFGAVVEAIDASAFVFEPWQLAAYATALRTKPFVILAGVSGTGKSRLPFLMSEATGGTVHRIAVRPDWTDSSDLLGYTDIEGQFRPGQLLSIARECAGSATHTVALLDEMNLARVEQYLAEALSAMEDRSREPNGGYASSPLMPQSGEDWSQVGLPASLAVVGTVNMDETTHGFSRKVIDRAFTLELSDVDLGQWKTQASPAQAATVWQASAWYPRATRLGELGALGQSEREQVTGVVDALTAANGHLADAQLQLGYRTRDEVALFVLHASELSDYFVAKSGSRVDPLDLAIHMKVLPRLVGGTGAIRRCLDGLLMWALDGSEDVSAEDAQSAVRRWVTAGRLPSLDEARYPRTAARLCLMRERLDDEGFTSYWL